MKRICVFCGSSFGADPAYIKAANELGIAIANRGFGLVYGGSCVGLMGEIASAVIKINGDVIGVITKDLVDREVANHDLSDLRIVGSMHERKSLMAKISDGFIAMPGGYGTLEEIFEVITWAQLNFHNKPCGFLNIHGYYDNLIKFLDHSVSEGFIEKENREMIIIDNDVESLLDRFLNYEAPKVDKAKRALEMLNRRKDRKHEL